MVGPVQILQLPVSAHGKRRRLDIRVRDFFLLEQHMLLAAIQRMRLLMQRHIHNPRPMLGKRANHHVAATLGNPLLQLVRRAQA